MIQWYEPKDPHADNELSRALQWIELHSTPDYYQQLGIDPTATASEIRRAYWKLATLFHPDHQPSKFRAAAETRMKELNLAYGVLRCSQRRAIYDARLPG